MKIAIGNDHRGFSLKQKILAHFKEHTFCDVGSPSSERVDYPDYAREVAEKVFSGKCERGILICSTGIGMSIAANKFPGIRAAMVWDPKVAELTRQHNDSNILCLSGDYVEEKNILDIVKKWLVTPFKGGHHKMRLEKIEKKGVVWGSPLKNVDPQVYDAIGREVRRQEFRLEMIASENYVSEAVLEAQGSILTNKYAEGYPGKRYYGGCEYYDVIENLARERALKLFGGDSVNVQPHSGSQANMGVYMACLKPGDRIMGMDLSHGWHLTHGMKLNFSGLFFNVVFYGVRKSDQRIDFDQVRTLAKTHKPKLIIAGASAYPRIIDFKKFREICDEVGALLMVDMAHIAGLIAAGDHPTPIPHAEFVTTTTHKTLRGPRGGMIFMRKEFEQTINSRIFPGIQGGPLMHVIAAKAVSFKEALTDEFKTYQHQIVKNAKTLAEFLLERGYSLVSGGTDNHLLLIDLSQSELTGKDAEILLEKAGITVNKNTIPYETRKPFIASGVRIGTPACTTRGMKEAEMKRIGDFIDRALKSKADPSKLTQIQKEVETLCREFPYQPLINRWCSISMQRS